MAKGFDRLHVKSAVKSHNKFNLDESHLTTLDFGQIVPLYSKELVQGDKFNVKGNYFSRMAPLVKPTYGKFSFKTMSCFVPFHQVAYDIDAWFDGKTTWEGVTPQTRLIFLDDFIDLFTYYPYGCSNIVTGGQYDLGVTDTSGNFNMYRFTRFGKYVYKVLCSLGYALPQNVDLQVPSSWTSRTDRYVSALPLLCFAKAYNDYMSQSQRFNTSQLTDFLRKVKYNIDYGSYYQASTGLVQDAGLKLIFDNIKLCYENDYFTSAWQWPNSALNVNETRTTGADIVDSGIAGVGSDYAYNTKDNTYLMSPNAPLVGHTGYTQSALAQRSLNMLRAFDDFVRRNNYSGSRAVQQIYSRFGIKPEDYKSHYAEVIGTEVMPVQVGDVTATTGNAGLGQYLGDYAGKGIMSGSKGFSYHASDRGLLMVLGWYTVIPMNAYGFDRSVLRTNPFDYYNPEFDGVAVDAISLGEVFTDPTSSKHATDTTQDNEVFGFTEKYNDYRFGRDKITGDFRQFDNSSPDNDWHTGRLLTEVREAGELVAQSSSMNTLPQYDSEYQRIFAVSGVDPFYLTCRFDVSAMRPMLSLNQVPNLGEGEVNVARNGNEIN